VDSHNWTNEFKAEKISTNIITHLQIEKLRIDALAETMFNNLA
jgi:hypothetical protein